MYGILAWPTTGRKAEDCTPFFYPTAEELSHFLSSNMFIVSDNDRFARRHIRDVITSRKFISRRPISRVFMTVFCVHYVNLSEFSQQFLVNMNDMRALSSFKLNYTRICTTKKNLLNHNTCFFE